MSKKKPGKKAANKTARKAPAKKTAPAKARAASMTTRSAIAPPGQSKKTSSATIFLYKANGEHRVRTSPQLLTAGPGYIEWTVVNLASDEVVDVDITWPNGSPWDGKQIKIKGGNERKSLEGANPGRFKYNVTANGYTEDPEVEYPDGN